MVLKKAKDDPPGGEFMEPRSNRVFDLGFLYKDGA
jgi:hypothetical protein